MLEPYDVIRVVLIWEFLADHGSCFEMTWAGALVQWLKLGKSENAGSSPTLAFTFQRNKNVSSLLTRKDATLWRASLTKR